MLGNKTSMKTFKLPTRLQLIFAGIFWFLICIGFQTTLIYQLMHAISPIDISVTACTLIVSIFFIYILQRYSAHYFNNLFTRVGILGILIFKVIFIQKFLISRLIISPAYSTVFNETLLIRVFTVFLVITFFSFVLWLVFYIRKTDEHNALQASAENSLREAELIKLRQQIQPHFLFNSLNSINALVGSEPSQARKMIQNLSDFLRGTLKKDENKPVLLSEELDLLRLYLDIEKVRFGHRLNVIIRENQNLSEAKIPPMLLQPIVENAIKFGLYNVLENVEITIEALVDNNLLNVSVTNPFDESTAITRKGEGFGLSLIQRRLQLIYHRADLLRTEKQNNIFITTILIPQ